MKPIIKDASHEDLTDITKIYAQAVLHGRASFELRPPDEDEMRRRFDNLVDNNFPYLVAHIDGKVAGYAYAASYRERPAYRWVVENSVYVSEDFQGNGIGRALLDRLIEECTEKDFRQMIAVIGDSDNTGSIRLHEKAGFTHTGVLRAMGRKHGLWLDTVLMQLALGQGSDTPPLDE